MSFVTLDAAVLIAMWTAVIFLLRRNRGAVAASARRARGIRLRNAGVVLAAAGITLFVAWLLTDSAGPEWLHASSGVAALAFIAAAAALSAYAGWLGAP
jgi:hypothetical protein